MKDIPVSRTVAILAKAKGFTEPCHQCYFIQDEELCSKWEMVPANYNDEKEWSESYTSVPPQAGLQKWLRMKYNLHIIIGVNQKGQWAFGVFDFRKEEFRGFKKEQYKYFSHEIALDKALVAGLYRLPAVNPQQE